jgi:hypothetical protein
MASQWSLQTVDHHERFSKERRNMLAKLHPVTPARCLLIIPGIALATFISGCGSMDFTSVSFQYPVYSTGKTEPNAWDGIFSGEHNVSYSDEGRRRPTERS